MTTADVTTLVKKARRRTTPQLRVVRGSRGMPRDTTVRWELVRSARARIDAGYYDLPEVRERVLSAVLDEIGDP